MEAVDEYTPLNLINDQKAEWKVRVKVHITCKKTYWKNPNNASSLEMILVDYEGNKIRAAIDKPGMAYWGNTFTEGHHFEMSSFGVAKQDDDVPLIPHAFKIHILRSSKVRKTDAFDVQRDVFRVVNYDDVNQRTLKSDEIFDVLGKLVELNPLRVTRSKGMDTKCIEFKLQDRRFFKYKSQLIHLKFKNTFKIQC
ncbi:uncharacterized protein [Rutidosis leptorrhynchoides]|uniref:uncharacterized protein n=1 Tax=Rutidosis leptorrhynchoides TaxID=125765 RepID=UPI003A9A49F7